MTESRPQLLAREEDLLEILRSLERDRANGSLDGDAYVTARARYEAEAAAILETLDALQPEVKPVRAPGGRSQWPAIAAATGLVIAAMVIFLLSALGNRSNAAPLAAPGATPVPSDLVMAKEAVRRHPHDLRSLLALGNAYLDAGNPAAAQKSYQEAVGVAPRDPVSATLLALALSSNHRDSEALLRLRVVETAHPRYARAWLLDGLISGGHKVDRSRAIRALRRFLVLQPHGTIAAEVRLTLKRLGAGGQ